MVVHVLACVGFCQSVFMGGDNECGNINGVQFIRNIVSEHGQHSACGHSGSSSRMQPCAEIKLLTCLRACKGKPSCENMRIAIEVIHPFCEPEYWRQTNDCPA